MQTDHVNTVIISCDNNEDKTIYNDIIKLPKTLYQEYENLCKERKKQYYCLLKTISQKHFIGVVGGVSTDDTVQIECEGFDAIEGGSLVFSELKEVKEIKIKPLDPYFYCSKNYKTVMKGILQGFHCVYSGMVLSYYLPIHCGIKKIYIEVESVNGSEGYGYLEGEDFKLSIQHPFEAEQIVQAMKKDQIKSEEWKVSTKTSQCEYCKNDIPEDKMEDHLFEECKYRAVECEGCRLYYPKCYQEEHEKECRKYQEISGEREKEQKEEKKKEDKKEKDKTIESLRKEMEELKKIRNGEIQVKEKIIISEEVQKTLEGLQEKSLTMQEREFSENEYEELVKELEKY
ncbi:hypothetical protein CL6EHI_125960 [Entamoeba histolytica]|uniref:TRAF-type domain-containing protein n=2 Tax=Entamoeba histolytica TaxID=5759 RepID=C4LVY1_ENTH1|nr:hypothetical protein EHI_125960 [Entamoeba histolytica HM-1:IMSS]EAL47638.1 hypothetical protein EHI_125960 [Entamoeba histolytica HM-1:IMSS]GAT92840.1 hypothetical protein CL6EHI_125960 [Entamoeba histolytica]|eukprot:XP_653024.1 hypothetical protein EHI_125960 [Entamoeba histolytica HM-1:IMSS]